MKFCKFEKIFVLLFLCCSIFSAQAQAEAQEESCSVKAASIVFGEAESCRAFKSGFNLNSYVFDAKVKFIDELKSDAQTFDSRISFRCDGNEGGYYIVVNSGLKRTGFYICGDSSSVAKSLSLCFSKIGEDEAVRLKSESCQASEPEYQATAYSLTKVPTGRYAYQFDKPVPFTETFDYKLKKLTYVREFSCQNFAVQLRNYRSGSLYTCNVQAGFEQRAAFRTCSTAVVNGTWQARLRGHSSSLWCGGLAKSGVMNSRLVPSFHKLAPKSEVDYLKCRIKVLTEESKCEQDRMKIRLDALEAN